MNGTVKAGVAAAVLAIAVGATSAQSRWGSGTSQVFDPSTVITVEGKVVRYVAALGQRTPQLVVRTAANKSYTFTLGPYHYLQSQHFSAGSGDDVQVRAFKCSNRAACYAAMEVNNISRNLMLKLRDSNGRPLWTGRSGAPGQLGGGHAWGAGKGNGGNPGNGAGNGRGMCGGAGPDMTRQQVYTGTIKSFEGGFGSGFPHLALTTAGGDVDIVTSPYRVLATAEVDLSEGRQLEVKAAPVTFDSAEHWVAITLKDLESGVEVELRDPETGIPAPGGWCRQ